MTTANASCPLAIAPATIAAWRDGALPGDESARIAAHVSGCEACRREIALYESLDDTLRRQPVPQSDGSLWRAVRAGMDNTHRPRNTRWTVRRVAGAATALAAVLLLALGFAQIFQARGNVIYHPSSTTTSVQGTPTPPG
jgi:anti-sigma factor RsiW